MNEFRPIITPITDTLWATKFTDAQLQFLRDDLDALQRRGFKGNDKMNNNLIGAIEHEYRLSPDVKDKLEELLKPLLNQQVTQTRFQHEFSVLSSDVPLALNDTWVNFQKKYEYNPVHYHSGVFSFVLWLKIPYSREKEDNHPGSTGLNGSFCVFFPDQWGRIQDYNLNLDHQYEGVCVMFPAETRHCVYPFYTSDEYRISVSGNYVLKTS